MKTAAVLACGVLSLCLHAPAALADGPDCTPRLVTWLDMIDEPDGRIAVSVGMAGAQHRMLLASSAAHSELFQPFVSTAGYRQFNLSERKHFYRLGGEAVGYANVDAMTLGTANGGQIQMLVSPGPYAPDAAVVGVLGADVLANFDLDLDFKAHKVNLFASNPCDGKPVYWTAHYSELPMGSDEDGRVASTMTLNGKPVLVELDTLSLGLKMRFDVANALYGLDAASPGVTPSDIREDGRVAYRYPFDTLTASGIAIAKPDILLVGDPHAVPCNGKLHRRDSPVPGLVQRERCWDGGDVTMGLHELRQMHLYFAYKAHKLYFSDAR